MWLEYLNKKKAEDFNKELTKNVNDNLMQIGTEDDEQIFKIVINPEAEKTICFLSGIHGNEEGGPYGVLEFLKSKFHVPTNKRVIFIPLANPSGFKKGTRNNINDIDLNREFLKKDLIDECKTIWDSLKDEQIDLFCSLHEDPGLKSFYLYYTNHEDLAKDLIDLAKKYFTIFPRDARKSLDGEKGSDKIIGGMIPLPHIVRGTLEDKMFWHKNVPYITIETPGKANIKKRIEFNKNAIKMLINYF